MTEKESLERELKRVDGELARIAETPGSLAEHAARVEDERARLLARLTDDEAA